MSHTVASDKASAQQALSRAGCTVVRSAALLLVCAVGGLGLVGDLLSCSYHCVKAKYCSFRSSLFLYITQEAPLVVKPYL